MRCRRRLRLFHVYSVYVDDVCSKLYFFVKRSRCRRHDARVKSSAEMCLVIAAALNGDGTCQLLRGHAFYMHGTCSNLKLFTIRAARVEFKKISNSD